MKSASFALAVGMFARAVAASALPPQTADFDELSRRASAALQSDPRGAVELYTQALALRPSWAEGWFDLAAAFYENGQYGQSREAFGRAAVLAPQKGAVWAFLGLCEYELHDYPRALSDMAKGETLGLPDNPQFVSSVHNRAALICLRDRDFSAAVQQLQPLAKLGDASPATIDAFGVSVLGLPYVPPDIPAAKRPLIELAGRVEWQLSAEHEAQAGQLLQQLVAQYPAEPGVHYLNGIYLLGQDQAAARAEFDKELQISPSNAAARLQIAILEIRADHPDRAIVLARQALALEPDNALGHAVLARAYMDQREFVQALGELKRAASFAPQNAQIHFYLQQVYRQLGKTAEAEKETAEFKRLRSEKDSLGLSSFGETGAPKN